MKMKISQNGIDLIKGFEGLSLKSYKALPTEKYFTIGYGHYSADLEADTRITVQIAEIILKYDLEKYEDYVNALFLPINQNQFDALVSFTYNCGKGNLIKLTTGRTVEQIGNALTLYNKAGGQVLKGLVRRREAEKQLYFAEV